MESILNTLAADQVAHAIASAGQDAEGDTSAVLTVRRLTRDGVKDIPYPFSSYNVKCTGLVACYPIIIETEGMGCIDALCTHVRHRWNRNANIVEGVVQLILLLGQLVAFWRAPPLHALRAETGVAGQIGHVPAVVQGEFAARHPAMAFYQMITPLLDHLKGLYNYLDLKEGEGVHLNATSLQLLAIKGADLSCTEQQRRLSQQLVAAANRGNGVRGGGGRGGHAPTQPFHPIQGGYNHGGFHQQQRGGGGRGGGRGWRGY